MNNRELSYLYGLVGTDGTVKQKDKHISITIELQQQDKNILEKLQKLIPNSTITERSRDTNFKNNYSSCSLYFSNKDIINTLLD